MFGTQNQNGFQPLPLFNEKNGGVLLPLFGRNENPQTSKDPPTTLYRKDVENPNKNDANDRIELIHGIKSPWNYGYPYGYGLAERNAHINNNIPVHLQSSKPPEVNNPLLRGVYSLFYPYYQR